MRLAPLACLLLASLVAGCGHVPLASLPKLSKVDIRTTELSQLRAGISLPADVRPLPGGVTMTIVAMAKDGGRHERKAVLEEVRDAAELASLPVLVTPGRRFTLFKLDTRKNRLISGGTVGSARFRDDAGPQAA